MTESYYKKQLKNLLDKNFNKYITYYLLIGTPIIFYIISTHHHYQWLISSSLSLSCLIFYLTLISVFTLITDTFNMRYNIFTRFMTSIIILLSSIFMIMIIVTPSTSYLLIFLFLLSSIITTSIFELSTIIFRTISKECIIDIIQSIYNILNIIISKIIENKMLLIMIFIFITPLILLIPLHGGPFGTGGLTPHADANVTINQYSYYNSSDYNVVVEINDLENAEYLVIKEKTEKSEVTVTECPNSELNNVDYLPTNEELQLRSNESGSVSSDVHSKYASILTTKCQFAIVKGLNINDEIQVYGGIDGSENLISEYTVQSIK